MEMQERPAHVAFEARAVEDRTKSIEEGHAVYKDVVFAIVTPPGGNLVIEKKAEDWLKGKQSDPFFRHYKESYRAFLEDREAPVDGTPIEMWPAISPAQVKQVRAAGLRSVEDLAAANENSIGKMGMGARALKQRAVSWLESAGDTGKVAEENAALKARLDDLQETVDRQAKQIEDLKKDDKPKRRTKKDAA